MIFVRLLTSLLFLTPWLFGDTTQDEDYRLYVTQIAHPIAQEAQKEFNLAYIGRGGQLANGVGKIEVDFIAYRRGSLEETRKIQVVLMERLLQALNSHEKLRPFLIEYPFPASRVCVMLSYRQEDNAHYTDGSITLAFQSKNNICYYYYSKADNEDVAFREPYEEAKHIVLGNSSEGL